MLKITISILLLIYIAIAIEMKENSEKKFFEKNHQNLLGGFGPEKVTQLIGFLPVGETTGNNTHLFYWFFESRTDPSKDPLLIWFGGGPGCSAMVSVFYEHGPYRIEPTSLKVNINQYSWNAFANVLYVDIADMGFSWSSSDVSFTEKYVSSDMASFVWRFLRTYPQYQSRKVFLGAESFLARYIPAAASKISASTGYNGINVNLKGIILGSAWLEPYYHFGSYQDFAYDTKLIGYFTYQMLNPVWGMCSVMLSAGMYSVAASDCKMLITSIISESESDNIYDIHRQCVAEPACYDYSVLNKFLAQDWVKKALNIINPLKFETCNEDLSDFSNLVSYSSSMYDIAALLNDEVSVLLYNGENDFITNWMAGQQIASSIAWKGADAFRNASLVKWSLDGRTAGEAQSNKALTWVTLYSAGHSVSYDQPKASLAMIANYLKGLPFGTGQ